MKTTRHFAGILLLFIFVICLYSCIGPVPVDVVMIDNDLYFVLDEEQEIGAIQVSEFNPDHRNNIGKTMWALHHDLTTAVKQRKYAELKKIKYGQALDEYPEVVGPFQLKRNVAYLVGINMGNKFAREVFIVTDDNRVIMPQRKVKEKRTE